MSAILETIDKGLMLIGGAELTTEVPHGIVIIQGQAAHEGIQFLETISDLGRVRLVGLCVSLIQLIQDGVTVAVARIKGMGLYVGFQHLGDVIHGGTSWRRRASLTARLLHRDIGAAGSAYSGIGAVRGAPAAARQGTGLRLVFAVA